MQEFLGLKDKNNFKEKYLKPLVESGQLELTIPDKPTSRNQKYIAANSKHK
jgi:ATP-dependent DNA helicase RecG